MRESIVRLVAGLLDEDPTEVTDQLLSIGQLPDDTDVRQVRLDVDRLIGRYSGLPESKISLAGVMEELMGLLFRYRVQVPGFFPQVLRAMVLTDANCRALNDDFDFREQARKVAFEVFREWYKPRNVLKQARRIYLDGLRAVGVLPRQVSDLVARLTSEGLRVNMEPRHLEEPLRRMDAMSNRMAFALVVASMIIGSSVMLASERAVSLLSTPGAVAYGIIGAVMGLYLIYSIVRSGRL
jgi:ubiquinone biosynthesis protein